ncbi:Nramp family divalent metal transporter [Chitinasiproducens palmae]|uniref:Manganese transport protein n=1 Tax=Chitinasiproducens palmae TaxID=1770053 RepID=A0A1H2PUK6_9BURK|nr:Nramp family divalent metal transporter [Chitinasiproducens palmae]SDV50506.1 manganese transport protein [Chitinasiproducens palmae]
MNVLQGTVEAVQRPQARPPTRRWFSFLGAGAMVAVGYMDPGNWATDLAAGAQFGYNLLFVVLVASVAGMLLQWIASRVGLVTRRDLAELCREYCGPKVATALWLAAEVAIVACDVAEVVGSAVALQLLLGISLTSGVLLSAIGTIALLSLRSLGARAVEIAITFLIVFVAASLAAQLAAAHPDWHAVAAGVRPSPELLRHAGMVWLAAGILGATVMPHNLYLHSALVKRHAPDGMPSQIRLALRSVNIDTIGALVFAFLINAGLLVVAAAVFHEAGQTQLDDLAEAHRLLTPLVGAGWAGPLFAAALLACGLNSTVTGTLAGQVVMEGFTRLRIRPWQRALLTRALALAPALAAVAWFGDGSSNRLLVSSQVVLSLQLPLAIVPMMIFATRPSLMGPWRVRGLPLVAAWAFTGGLVILNGALLWQTLA